MATRGGSFSPDDRVVVTGTSANNGKSAGKLLFFEKATFDLVAEMEVGSTLHSFMAKQISVKNKDDRIDPRERILRHAKESEENPY